MSNTGNRDESAAFGVLAWIGVGIVSCAVFLAIFSPWLIPYDPTQATENVSMPPPPLSAWPSLFWQTIANGSPTPHWFGTDASGLDVFSRTIEATRTDLIIALSANIVSVIIGVSLGVISGYFRNIWTETLLRTADLLQSFPVFITAMILVALAGRSWVNIVLAMSLLYAPIYLRLTRTEVLALRERSFIEAARALGKTELGIARHHILPNAIGPSLIQFSVTIGFAILLTAGLSFVGAGVRPPTPEWGSMIATGATQLVLGDWWPSLFPGIAISVTVFGFAVCGHVLEKRYGR
ncbi:MAG: ABC transporter permease subunit [Alphaproteobacteria bacterium]|nr:ABC transporter permease subunit [Alphaproteobacteria bacterium]